MSKILVPICLLVTALLFFCDDSTSPPEPEPIVFEGICGDINGDAEPNTLDLGSYIEYLTYGEELIDTLAGDVDNIRGVNSNDMITYLKYLYDSGESLNCEINWVNTVLPISADTVFIRNGDVPSDTSSWSVSVYIKPIDHIDYLTVPVKYSSNLGSFRCDSVDVYHEADWGIYHYTYIAGDEHYPLIDVANQKIPLYTVVSPEQVEDGKRLMAVIYFSFDTTMSPGQISIDTTTIYSSSITILSRYNHPHTIAYKPVIVFE